MTVGGGNSLNVTGTGTAGGSISLLADDDIIFTASGDLTNTTGDITVTGQQRFCCQWIGRCFDHGGWNGV